LAYQHAQVDYAEHFVKTVQETIKKELAVINLGRSIVNVDVGEAEERLRQFQNDLTIQTRDMNTSETQLRIILGLPKSDNRRLVPTTRPLEERVCFNWDVCLREMLQKQPEIVQMKLETETLTPNTDLRQAIAKSTERLRQCLHNLDANYDQYLIAKRCRTAAAERMEIERKYYDEGRITIDRYLSSMHRNATAAATEAQALSTYNTSLAALGERKGTLLADRFILVLDEPLRQPKNWISERDK
jgi:outer membrane protein TolC